MRLGAVLVVITGVVAALAVVQSSAGGRSVLVSRPRARTIATVHNLDDVAQDGRYVAWAVFHPGNPNAYPGCGHTVVVIQDMRTGRRVQVPARPLGACIDGFWGLTLAGNRAYALMTTVQASIQTDTLFTASLDDRKARSLGAQDTPNGGPVAVGAGAQGPFAPVSDGRHVYSWLTYQLPPHICTNCGDAIVRFQGRRRRRLDRSVAPPDLLAAGGARFAWAAFASPSDDASSPAWSPDGKEIAYTRHGQLWVVNADGTDPHQIVASGSQADWSPDGTKLAYVAPSGKVVVANADGSDPKLITKTDGQIPTNPAWSPDGSELAVEGSAGILIVSVDGKNRRLVIPGGEEPDWSPDGSRLVYTNSNGALWVANADGSNRRRLTGCGSDPAWSPDGSEIATDCDGMSEIRPDGTGLQHLHTGSTSDDGFSEPAWGPDPGQLVFSETIGNDSHLVLWPGERQITTGGPETITVQSEAGNAVAHINPGDPPFIALAVSRRVLAALVREPNRQWAVEIYQPTRRTVPLPTKPEETGWRQGMVAPPSTRFSAAGTTLVFQIGHTIETLNALRGSPHPVATTKGQLDLSIFGRRIVWADRGRIRILNLGR
jgi:TolB protein